jgi:hypothetical protein
MENTEKEKRSNYRQQIGSRDRLLAMVAVKLKMSECSYISVLGDIHSSTTEEWRAVLAV